MIHTERTKDGVTIGMSGVMNDLLAEVTVILKDILKHIPEERRGLLMAEISARALDLAQEENEDCNGRAEIIEKPDILAEAIKKVTGGRNE